MPDTKPKADTKPAEPKAEAKPVEVVSTEKISGQGDLVSCRISKSGDGKVATGQSKGKRFYAWKDQVEFPLEVAGTLEDRGLLEIE